MILALLLCTVDLSELKRDVPKLIAKGDIATALQRMFDVDQQVRNGRDVADMQAIDTFTTATLKTLLQKIDWFTISKYGETADQNGWLLVQHADLDPAFQKDVLARLTRLVEKNETSRSNYAYLWDRVAGHDNRPQRYGTQGRCTGPGAWEPRPIEDEAHVDERRAWAGITAFPTLAAYKAQMHQHCR